MKQNLLFLMVIMVSFSGCSLMETMKPTEAIEMKAYHAVMTAGQEVNFENPNGSGKISYVSDFMRRYEINGRIYDVNLVQRSKEFDHRNGIYNPGETWGPLPLADGVPSRFVVDESEIRFNTNEECDRFFKEGAAYEKWVCNNQGLVLGFDLSPSRDQVNVSLYRCYIAGELMKALPPQFQHAGYVRLR